MILHAHTQKIEAHLHIPVKVTIFVSDFSDLFDVHWTALNLFLNSTKNGGDMDVTCKRSLKLCTHGDSEMFLFQHGGPVYLGPRVHLPDKRQTHPPLLETVVLHVQFCTYLNIVDRFQSKVAKISLYLIFASLLCLFWSVSFLLSRWQKSCLRSKYNWEKYILTTVWHAFSLPLWPRMTTFALHSNRLDKYQKCLNFLVAPAQWAQQLEHAVRAHLHCRRRTQVQTRTRIPVLFRNME